MSDTSVNPAIATPVVTAEVRTVLLLVTTAFLAFVVYYFVGIDEGVSSVFGNTTVIHEFFHDGRHFLGFPCH